MELDVNTQALAMGIQAHQGVDPQIESLPVIDMEVFERQKKLLPPLPQIMSRIDEVLRSGDSDVKAVSELVSSEVSLVARILRIVNSAYFGLPRQVEDISQAIALLGFREIHRIVLTSSVAEAFKDLNPVYLTNYWKHSYFTALIAKEIARRDELPVDAGVLWPAALLHDMGELVYMRLFPAHYKALMEHRLCEHTTMDLAEDAMGYPPHRELGAELCDFWGLPSTVKDACMNHCMVREDFVDERIYIMRRTVTAADLLSVLALESLREDVQLEIRDILSVILHRSDEEVSSLLGEFIGWRPEVERMAAI